MATDWDENPTWLRFATAVQLHIKKSGGRVTVMKIGPSTVDALCREPKIKEFLGAGVVADRRQIIAVVLMKMGIDPVIDPRLGYGEFITE